MYSPIFTHNIWSYLLRPPVIIASLQEWGEQVGPTENAFLHRILGAQAPTVPQPQFPTYRRDYSSSTAAAELRVQAEREKANGPGVHQNQHVRRMYTDFFVLLLELLQVRTAK